MRKIFLGNPPEGTLQQSPSLRFVFNALREIEQAADEDYAADAADGFTVTNYTETRTLNAATATATDVANVLATFLFDLKKRGSKRRS